MINTNIINSYPFLYSGGGLSSVGELLGLKEKALAALLKKVVLALVLPDLHHVVFPPPPRLVRIHPSFVRLLPGIRPGAWPQRHFCFESGSVWVTFTPAAQVFDEMSKRVSGMAHLCYEIWLIENVVSGY
nr:hypothetical protein TEA_025091 [Ipomoea batatas]